MKALLHSRTRHAALLGLLLTLQGAAAQTTTSDVDVTSPEHTLYTDPYNGNEIKVGGFSGFTRCREAPTRFMW